MATKSRTRPGELHDDYHPMPDIVTLARFLLELELQDTRFSPKLAQDLHLNISKAPRLLRNLRVLDRDHHARVLFIGSMNACLDPKTYIKRQPQAPNIPLREIYQNIINPLEQNLLSLLGARATWP